MIDVRTGDIVLFRTPFKLWKPASWLSALIRYFAKIKYNHVGVVVSNWNVPFVNEALGRGVIPSPFKDRVIGVQVKILRPNFYLADGFEKAFATKANSKLGITGYDFSGLLFFQLVYQIFGVWIGTKNKKRAEKRMYCYEYVGWCYSNLFPDWWKINPAKISDIANFSSLFEGKL